MKRLIQIRLRPTPSRPWGQPTVGVELFGLFGLFGLCERLEQGSTYRHGNSAGGGIAASLLVRLNAIRGNSDQRFLSGRSRRSPVLI